MAVKNGEEALALLLHSSRVNTDISRTLDHSEHGFKMYLLLRKFCPIEPSMEFRGFVYNNKLTAVSQYYDSCFFQELVENKIQLKKKNSGLF